MNRGERFEALCARSFDDFSSHGGAYESVGWGSLPPEDQEEWRRTVESVLNAMEGGAA